MPESTCTVDGCHGSVRARGWCSKHYQRWQVNGDLSDRLRPIGCSMDSCNGKRKAQGLCDTHYQRLRAHGDPTVPGPPRRRRPPTDAPKECNACKVTKPRSEFSARPGRRADSVSAYCKACDAERTKRWNAANPDRIEAWNTANRERRRRYTRNWREKPRSKELLRLLEARRSPIVRRAKSARRRARIRQNPVEKVDFAVVFAAYEGRCGICGGPVDPGNYHMDHIVAIANGGAHTASNLQPAHPVCNQRKGARPWPSRTPSPFGESETRPT